MTLYHLFECPFKSHTHTNPDGSTIVIRSLDVDERSFWDELSQEWIKSEKKKRKEGQKEMVPNGTSKPLFSDDKLIFRRVVDPTTFVELYREYYDKEQQKLIRVCS